MSFASLSGYVAENDQAMTLQELRERQTWSLDQKIDHALGTIESFVNKMGGGG